MPYIMVDIESDGPIPGDYSMISFGAVLIDEQLSTTFYGRLRPISDTFIPEALAVSGHSREETLAFDEPQEVMECFAQWLKENCTDRPVFISDNNGFDWMFICWYFHHFTGANPFGFSSQNLGSLYKGLVKRCLQKLQASAKDQAHAPPGRRRPRQCRSPPHHEGRAGAENQDVSRPANPQLNGCCHSLLYSTDT